MIPWREKVKQRYAIIAAFAIVMFIIVLPYILQDPSSLIQYLGAIVGLTDLSLIEANVMFTS